MVIPEFVVIDGLVWEVRIADITDCGDCDPHACHIRISRQLDEQLREQTFWHELIHAIFASREVPDDRKLTQEEVCRIVGPALFAFFRYNSSEIGWADHGGDKA